MEALVDQGVVRLVEQLLEKDRGARVGEPTAHCPLLSFGEVPVVDILASLAARAGSSGVNSSCDPSWTPVKVAAASAAKPAEEDVARGLNQLLASLAGRRRVEECHIGV